MNSTKHPNIITLKQQKKNANRANNNSKRHLTKKDVDKHDSQTPNSAMQGLPPVNTKNVGHNTLQTPRATDYPNKNNNIIYYQNVQGLRGSKLEYISRLMTEKNIQAFIIVETHLEGVFTKFLPKGQLMTSQPRQTTKTKHQRRHSNYIVRRI